MVYSGKVLLKVTVCVVGLLLPAAGGRGCALSATGRRAFCCSRGAWRVEAVVVVSVGPFLFGSGQGYCEMRQIEFEALDLGIRRTLKA